MRLRPTYIFALIFLVIMTGHAVCRAQTTQPTILAGGSITEPTTFMLQPGTVYTLQKSLSCSAPIHFVKNGGDNAPAPTVNYSGWGDSAALQLFRGSDGSRIDGVHFQTGPSNYCVSAQGCNGATVTDCDAGTGSGGFFLTHGCSNIEIQRCATIRTKKYGVFLGGDLLHTPNKSLSFIDCHFGPSEDESVFRAHGAFDSIINHCVLEAALTASGKIAALRLHDGGNWLVSDSIIAGRWVVGPLAGADGGINEADAAKKIYYASLRMNGARFTRCWLGGQSSYGHLQDGSISTFLNCVFVASSSGAAMSVDSGGYLGRPAASSDFANCAFVYVGGRLFPMTRPAGVRFNASSFNGGVIP